MHYNKKHKSTPIVSQYNSKEYNKENKVLSRKENCVESLKVYTHFLDYEPNKPVYPTTNVHNPIMTYW